MEMMILLYSKEILVDLWTEENKQLIKGAVASAKAGKKTSSRLSVLLPRELQMVGCDCAAHARSAA
jgi:hypothetical protein